MAKGFLHDEAGKDDWIFDELIGPGDHGTVDVDDLPDPDDDDDDEEDQAALSSRFTDGRAFHLIGNERSGNYGHAGRIGQVGGSGPSEGRSFKGDEGYEWHERPEMVQYAADLPDADRSAINDYASFGYTDINQQLRGTFKPHIINEFVRAATPEEIAAYNTGGPNPDRPAWGPSAEQRGFPPSEPSEYLPDDPVNKVADGRLVHNVYTTDPKTGDKVEWSIQRAVPNTAYVKDLEKTADRINASIRERGYTLEEPISVNRAAYIPGLSFEQLKAMEGGEMEEKGFTSTMVGDPSGRLDGYVRHGKHESVYKRTGKVESDEVGTAMRIQIVLPEGTKVAAVEPIRRTTTEYERDAQGMRVKASGTRFDAEKGARREAEVLLGSGARFRVKSVTKGKPIPTSPDGSLKGMAVADVVLEYVGGGSSEGG